MNTQRVIRKIGLIFLHGPEILLVRKRDTDKFILPGGKPDQNEDDVRCLTRELDEELGVELIPESLVFFGNFAGASANESARLELIVYIGDLKGMPKPQSEIEEMQWVDVSSELDAYSPLLKTAVMPRLREWISNPNAKTSN